MFGVARGRNGSAAETSVGGRPAALPGCRNPDAALCGDGSSAPRCRLPELRCPGEWRWLPATAADVLSVKCMNVYIYFKEEKEVESSVCLPGHPSLPALVSGGHVQ